MNELMQPEPDRLATRLRGWLDHPLTSFWCVMSWIGASLLFFVICLVLGGPTEGDAAEVVYGSWAVAHGHLDCIYPPVTSHHFFAIADPFALAAPLYPLLTGALAALLRIGDGTPFPTSQQLGPHCDNGFVAMVHWTERTAVILHTIDLSYVTWLVLLTGAVALVRAAGRGHSRWEPLAVLLMACAAPVAMCITYFFHPQDILAMGLVLIAAALCIRRCWIWVGVFLGLAFCAQQFAVLVAAALFVAAPKGGRLRLVVGAAVALVVIDVPLIVATSGRAIKTVLLGSSRVGYEGASRGGTVLWEAHLRGVPIFMISRVLPAVAAMLIAWYGARRLRGHLLDPVPLTSLVAIALILRLVFEDNLFGYYFMATTVALLLLEVVRGQLRGEVIAWVGMVMIAFNPVHVAFVPNLTSWAVNLQNAIPVGALAIILISVAYDLSRHRIRLYKLTWIALAVVTTPWSVGSLHLHLFAAPFWLWQIVLVPTAMALVVIPLSTYQPMSDPDSSHELRRARNV